MVKQDKTLLLFTGEFPYGKRGEPFLEDEILYLSNEFDKIIVFPRKKETFTRILPSNVFIQDNITNIKFRISKQSLFVIIKSIFPLFNEALRTKKGYLYLKQPKHFLFSWIEANILAIRINTFIKNNKIKNPFFYSYWSDSSLLACARLKNQGATNTLITRAHGFDLYNNRNFGGLIPFRNFMYKYTNKIYCISQHGQNYLKLNLPKNLHSKLKLSYLGVIDSSKDSQPSIPEIPIIISVARMEKFKRISTIPDVLQEITTPVHWIHFGDGYEYELVKQKIKNLSSNIKVTLMGQKKNQEILEFYNQNKISLFLSLSTSEGLPVSMMEAISYGIPILSTNINGVPEIVTKETGVLIDVNENVKEIAKKITKIIEGKMFNSSKIQWFYKNHFNAEYNYSTFAKELARL